jgi:hypothetical protein
MRALFDLRLLAVAILAISACARLGNAAEITLDLTIRHWQLSKGMRTIKVQEGDAVTLRLCVDRPMTLHLHGYDIERRVEPGAVTDITFMANATGRFPLEIHIGDHAEARGPIAYVEVYPR